MSLLLAKLSVTSWRPHDGITPPPLPPSMSVERRRAAALGGGGRAGLDGDAVDILTPYLLRL